MLIVGIAVGFSLPLIWMLLAAFTPVGAWGTWGPMPDPRSLSVVNFVSFFTEVRAGVYLVNSLFVASLAVLSQWYIASLSGYAIAKYRFAGRRVLIAIMIGLLVLPGELLLAPQYRIVQSLGLIDTSAGLVLPWTVNALGVLYFARVSAMIPDTLLEAARLDGCGEFRTHWRVVVPLTRPASCAFCLIAFITTWNGFLWPSIVLHRDAIFTLPLGVSQMINGYREDYGALVAGTVLAMLPPTVVFAVLKRGVRSTSGPR
jgi:multiple sugar transport system permease protein